MVALTIGMATYNDFDGVYFTLQALRFYQDLDDTELLVVDNYGCEHTKTFVEGIGGRYIRATDVVGTAAPRDLVFQQARGDAVLCCDSHVMLAPGAVKRLRKYYRKHPESIDLLQGPLFHDNLRHVSTHFDPVWRDQMWGVWATGPQGRDPDGEPFEIPMMGLGIFSCRKDAWPSFNPEFRGFGGEEGYIHEKFRQRGGRCLCLPWLRWLHRFARPAGVPYPLTVQEKLRNYLIGFTELGLDTTPVLEHYAEHLPPETIAAVEEDVQRFGISGPPRTDAADVGNGVSPVVPLSGRDGTLPLVSCICSTYNRPPSHQHLLEESIESFLRQTYPNKELIILNDCPGQELVCHAPGVRVVNAPMRFPTLGDKHNYAVALAQGELIAVWDDDDINLPWRLSLSVERLGKADYFNPKRNWIWDSHGLRAEPESNVVGHNHSLFTRAAFENVGGYAAMDSGLDQVIDRKFRDQVTVVGEPGRGEQALAKNEVYYIYRWGVSPAHLSAAESHEARAANYQRIGTRPVEEGRFTLRPHWRTDYVAEARQLLDVA